MATENANGKMLDDGLSRKIEWLKKLGAFADAAGPVASGAASAADPIGSGLDAGHPIDEEQPADAPEQTASFAGKPLLTRGSKGSDVRDLQAQLNKHGAGLAIDGDFGGGTEQAVQQFQSSNPPLKVDGKVGNETWAALARAAPVPPPPPPPPPDTTRQRVVITVASANTGNVIAGALVKVGDQAATTDNIGQTVLSLPPGRHPFGATADGFQQGIGDVDVKADEEAQLQIELDLAAPRSITIGPQNPPPLDPGGQQQFTATDDTGKDISREVAWSSSDPNIVAINVLGLATAGAAPGSTTIAATLAAATGSVGATGISNAIVKVTVATAAGLADLVKVTVIPADAVSASGIPGVGLDVTFRAIGEFRDGSSRDVSREVTWTATSTPPGVVTVGSEGTAGFNAEGNAVITATNPANTQVAGSAKLAVLPLGKLPSLQSITIEPASPPALTDKPLQLRATGKFSDGKNHEVTHEVTWSSPDPNIVTIDPGGLAKPGAVSGPVTIMATHQDPKVRPASITLTVSAPPPPPLVGLLKITIAPQNPLVPVGGSQRFIATGDFANGPPQDVTTKIRWSATPSRLAVISPGGAAVGKLAGTATISATDLTNPQVTGSTQLTVHPAGNPPALRSIAVTPANPTLTDFSFVQFTATGTFADGLDRDVTSTVLWSASNSNVTIGSTGIASPTASGTALISADDPTSGASGATVVTLALPALVKITIAPQTTTIVAGLTEQLVVNGEFADGSTRQGLTTITWTSSSPDVDVDPSGEATGKKVGSATVTATDNGTGISDSTTFTVAPPALSKITVTTNDPNIPSGRRTEFKATGDFSDGHTEDISSTVTWSSSSADVVIDLKGIATGGKPGSTADITATDPSNPQMAGSIGVTVVPPVLTGIRVSPNKAQVAIGGKVQFTAIGEFTDKSPPRNVTTQVRWVAGPGGLVSIDQNGLAVGLAAGSTFISVQDAANTTSQSVNIEVTQ